jgi:hypothetical protein
MRPLILLALALSLTAADLEQITLTDGRRLIGYYDEAAGKLTVEGPPKVVLNVTTAQVASRSPYVRAPEADPAKRDAAELVRLEAEREAALADIARLRKFASTRSGKDAEIALSQADERKAQADKLGDKISATRQRIEATAPKPDAAPQQSQASPQTAREEVAAAMAEVHALRDQAAAKEFDALAAFLGKADLEEMPVPALGSDPRQSEIDKRQQVMDENARRTQLRELLGLVSSRKTHVAKEAWSKHVLSVLDMIPRRSAVRDQEEAEERERSLPRRKTAKAK